MDTKIPGQGNSRIKERITHKLLITTLTVVTAVLLCSVSGFAKGIERVDISPAVIVNMADGHAGSFLGGSLTGDVFFSRAFALRTTIGFTKERYYPSDLNYADADYGFWLSFAPYAELSLGDRVMPYMALLGTFTTGGGGPTVAQPIGMEQKPITRLNNDIRAESFYSLGVTLGSKLRLAGPVSMYGEVSHYFFTSISDSKVYFGPGAGSFDRRYDFEHNPTYLSFGLTYSLDLGN